MSSTSTEITDERFKEVALALLVYSFTHELKLNDTPMEFAQRTLKISTDLKINEYEIWNTYLRLRREAESAQLVTVKLVRPYTGGGMNH